MNRLFQWIIPDFKIGWRFEPITIVVPRVVDHPMDIIGRGDDLILPSPFEWDEMSVAEFVREFGEWPERTIVRREL